MGAWGAEREAEACPGPTDSLCRPRGKLRGQNGPLALFGVDLGYPPSVAGRESPQKGTRGGQPSVRGNTDGQSRAEETAGLVTTHRLGNGKGTPLLHP